MKSWREQTIDGLLKRPVTRALLECLTNEALEEMRFARTGGSSTDWPGGTITAAEKGRPATVQEVADALFGGGRGETIGQMAERLSERFFIAGREDAPRPPLMDNPLAEGPCPFPDGACARPADDADDETAEADEEPGAGFGDGDTAPEAGPRIRLAVSVRMEDSPETAAKLAEAQADLQEEVRDHNDTIMELAKLSVGHGRLKKRLAWASGAAGRATAAAFALAAERDALREQLAAARQANGILGRECDGLRERLGDACSEAAAAVTDLGRERDQVRDLNGRLADDNRRLTDQIHAEREARGICDRQREAMSRELRDLRVLARRNGVRC